MSSKTQPNTSTNKEFSIQVKGLSKCYEVYSHPSDRLKQFVIPRVQAMFGLKPQQFFSPFWALKEVSFQVRKGETVGIIGRNGSGKSTLLQIICGTLQPSSGTVEVNGRVAALLELGAGFNPEFTGRENVYMNARVLGLSLEKTAERFDSITDFADIGDFIDRPVKTYSSGMMVRLAFAVIAHVDADILVIDEALAVGDVFFTQKCMRYLRNFMKTGTILFVSHDTGSVKSLCDEAIWLEKGAILQQGNTKEVSELYLQAFYEAQQGVSSTTKLKAIKQDTSRPLKDQRLEFINASTLRNDLEVFTFNPDADAFGLGGAEITHVEFLNTDYEPLNWVVGGETVCLQITVESHQDLLSPIIGFYIKDKLGQELFGDNTYLTYHDNPLPCFTGQTIHAQFIFEMPRLAKGDYSVTVAIANGTQQDHIQHHWIHDAVQFKSESNSVSGLIGIPMYSIKLDTELSENFKEITK